jgi:predicted amidophosphoribosyltransferase
MSTFHRTPRGIGYLKITWLELMQYSRNPHPVCDLCDRPVSGHDDIVLIPLLNQAYCPACGNAVANRMKNYPEDRQYAREKERFWLDYFKIEEVANESGSSTAQATQVSM